MRSFSRQAIRRWLILLIAGSGLLLPAVAQADPTFGVMNASGGIFWRAAPDWNTGEQTVGFGFYPDTIISVHCYQMGAANVPGSTDAMWEQATDVGGSGYGSGWINEHFINDGQPINQPSPGVPPCGSISSAPTASPSISASLGGLDGCDSCHALNISVSNFPPGTYTYQCHDNSGAGGSDTVFYSHAVSVTSPSQSSWPGVFCYDSAPYTAYLVMDGVRSNSVSFGAASSGAGTAPSGGSSGGSGSGSAGGGGGSSSPTSIATQPMPPSTPVSTTESNNPALCNLRVDDPHMSSHVHGTINVIVSFSCKLPVTMGMAGSLWRSRWWGYQLMAAKGKTFTNATSGSLPVNVECPGGKYKWRAIGATNYYWEGGEWLVRGFSTHQPTITC